MWGENWAGTEETPNGYESLSAQRKHPMDIKLFRHKGNTHGYQTIYTKKKTPWASKYLGTKETHMSIKLGRHRGNPQWVSN